jgi:hypothetical protein
MLVLALLAMGITSKALPFSSIKMKGDEIYVKIDPKCETWYKLLSVNSVGSDALIKDSKERFGTSPCDGEIECYKYNIIADFEAIYKKLKGEALPKWVPMEFEGNENQNGMDVISTEEKFKINEEHIEQNIKASKSTKIFGSPLTPSSLFKGVSESIQKIFNNESFLNTNIPENQIRKEIADMKNEIEQIEKQELEIEKVRY